RVQVWANVWQTPQVVRIDPETGQVLGWVDFSVLAEREPGGVLNGIAGRGRQIFVTGKRWNAIYRVQIKPVESREDIPCFPTSVAAGATIRTS
ncbi:MAG: glutaminyl-peptide cyclotransferase, partial [Anaerolineae bacterium]